MANIRAMVVLQGGSNLPEDRYVNTFHFLSPQDYANDSPLIATALDDFYSVINSAAPAVGSYLSPYVNRNYEIRTYDLADLPGEREPTIYEHILPAVHTTGAGSVPEEVSVCLSYHSIPPLTPRRRGRIYFGPLCAAAITAGSTTAPTRVAGGLCESLNAAAVVLASSGLGWAVYSPTADTWSLIVAGWTDDAFDTQRRRGADPSLKVLWNI